MATITVTSILSGCSKDEERQYALPESLCGVTVDSEFLSTFLPPGEKVSSQQETPNGGTQRCQVSVDGKIALVAGQLWWDKTGTVANVAAVHARVGKGEVTADEKFLYSGTGAVGKAEGCADHDHPDQDLFTVIQVFASGREDSSTMKRLINEYTEQIQAANDCD